MPVSQAAKRNELTNKVFIGCRCVAGTQGKVIIVLLVNSRTPSHLALTRPLQALLLLIHSSQSLS